MITDCPPNLGRSFHFVEPSPNLRQSLSVQYPASPFSSTGFADTQFASVSLRTMILLFTVIDRWFYEVLNIYQPLGFTLLEHSTIFYSEAVAPTSNDATRISFYVSLAVWIILISLFTALILLQQQSLVRSIRGKHNAK